MSSAVEFPPYARLGAVDEDTVYAYEMALHLHSGRYRIVPRIIRVANPAAGAEWSLPVDQGVTWVPLALSGTLTTSATVTTRAVSLRGGDGTSTPLATADAGGEGASGAVLYSWYRNAPGAIGAAGSQIVQNGLPLCSLFGGMILRSVTFNLQVGDQWSGVSAYVLEYQEAGVSERAQAARDLVTGAHTDLYPAIEKGL